MRRLLLVAGPSGSGKSRLARITGAAALSLDEFYFDHDHPDLPRSPLGIPDWDDAGTWDQDLALTTLRDLLITGEAELPCYDISQSRRVGMRHFDCRHTSVVLAEGIFAPETLRAAQGAGLPVEAIWLDRPRPTNFARRLARDLKERRKPPAVLVRRGIALYQQEPQLRRSALAAGFTPLTMRAAIALMTTQS